MFTSFNLLPSIMQAPELELRPHSLHLKYISLGKKETLPVIIVGDLSKDEEHKLVQVLKKYKKDIGWSIANFKGISPTMCMHHILMEDDSKPYRDGKRKFNRR